MFLVKQQVVASCKRRSLSEESGQRICCLRLLITADLTDFIREQNVTVDRSFFTSEYWAEGFKTQADCG